MTDEKEKEDYIGSFDEKGLPNGKGVNTFYFGNKIRRIQEGLWQGGFLVEGSETLFWHDWDKERAYAIKKEIGKWRYDKEKNFCEEFLSGEGEELYYKNEEDLKNNKLLGYVRGVFDNGTLIKGEVVNAFEIDYSDHSFVKKIIIKGSSKKNLKRITFGEIFFENGDRYEGEILSSMPQGKGTMHYKDGTYLEGKWVDGNLKEEKTT